MMDEDDILTFLRFEMRKRRITQRMLSGVIGMTESHLSMILCGKANCSLRLLLRMMDYVGCDLVPFKREVPEPAPKKVVLYS